MTKRIKWGPELEPGWEAVHEVSKAMLEGKRVRSVSPGITDYLNGLSNLSPRNTYQIGEVLPPRDFWVNVHQLGPASVCLTREEADKIGRPDRIECIHMREVIE